jgi:hypothetical protein
MPLVSAFWMAAFDSPLDHRRRRLFFSLYQARKDGVMEVLRGPILRLPAVRFISLHTELSSGQILPKT